VECWALSPDFSRSCTLQAKVRELIPPADMLETTTFSDRGFGSGVLRLRNGSVVWFKTFEQNLEGSTLDGVFIDEPPPMKVWDSLLARVNQRNGFVRIFLCPQDGGGSWLRPLVERGQVSEHHFDLSVKNCWPVGAMRPFKSQAQIDRFRLALRPSQVDQRVGGAWEGQPDDGYFPRFDATQHTVDTDPKGSTWQVSIGVDYGPAIGKPAVVLSVGRGRTSMRPEVVFLDEEVCPPDGRWNAADIAAAIKRLLDRRGIGWQQVDHWSGDRPAQDRRGSRQSNSQVWSHLMSLYGQPPRPSPFKVPRKWQGSVRHTCEWLDGFFALGQARVHRRCSGLIRFFEMFNGDPNHSTKDVGDAGRYSAMALVSPRWYGGPNAGESP
jgi:phage terminase large subunit-like protein